MTSVLMCPDGKTIESEAAHGTVTRHYRWDAAVVICSKLYGLFKPCVTEQKMEKKLFQIHFENSGDTVKMDLKEIHC